MSSISASQPLLHAQTHGTISTVAVSSQPAFATGSVVSTKPCEGTLVELPHGSIDSMQPGPSLPSAGGEPVVPISEPNPQLSHNMHTCSMEGILKPKTLLATKFPLSQALQTTIAPNEPICYSQAVKSIE